MIVESAGAMDSSPVLLDTYFAGFLPEFQDGVNEYKWHTGLFESSSGLVLAWNVVSFVNSDMVGYSRRSRLGIDRWSPSTHSHARIVEPTSYLPTQPSYDYRPFPIAFQRISEEWDGRRYRFLRRPTDPRDYRDSTFVRIIDKLGTNGAIVTEAVVDTILALGTDMSTFPLPSTTGVDLLQRRPDGSVLVERMSEQGNILDSLVLPISVRSYQNTGLENESDFEHPDSSLAALDLTGRRLPDGRVLLAWSAVGSDDSADVYIGLFGSDWTMLAPPKRLNSDTRRDQIGARLHIRGDSVSVAWLDDRNGEWHIYYRCFAIDRVLSTGPEQYARSFDIEGPWPHPATLSATFTLKSGERNVSLRIVNILGGEVWTGSTTGATTISVDVESWPPGLYFLHATTEEYSSGRLFVVR